MEETERFYKAKGFRVAGRFGKNRTFHPPLEWEDFRDQAPFLRIVEVRRGQVNITFGQGSKTMFDHIGWLVSKTEHDEICGRARKLGWNVNTNERRTFIGTPIRLRMELQQNMNAIDEGGCELRSLDVAVKNPRAAVKLPELLGRPLPELSFQEGKQLKLLQATLKDPISGQDAEDPNGVKLHFVKQENNDD